MPAKREGTAELAVRPEIVNHGLRGGPKGLYSVSGVKFTTSHAVAVKVLKLIFPSSKPTISLWKQPKCERDRSYEYDFSWKPTVSDVGWLEDLKTKIREESVCHLDDLLCLGDNPGRLLELSGIDGKLFGWDKTRMAQEKQRLHEVIKIYDGH